MTVFEHLFPKSRAEAIRLLFSEGGKELHLRDLARMAGLSPATLQKELVNLTDSGLVISRRDGNRLYFHANANHPIYPELHNLVLKTSGIAAQLQRLLQPVPEINKAFIFGSIAAGTDTPNSDVDVLLLGTVSLRQVAPILRQLASALHREINPHCLSPDEWQEKLQRGDAFITRVWNEPKLWLKGGPDEFGIVG